MDESWLARARKSSKEPGFARFSIVQARACGERGNLVWTHARVAPVFCSFAQVMRKAHAALLLRYQQNSCTFLPEYMIYCVIEALPRRHQSRIGLQLPLIEPKPQPYGETYYIHTCNAPSLCWQHRRAPVEHPMTRPRKLCRTAWKIRTETMMESRTRWTGPDLRKGSGLTGTCMAGIHKLGSFFECPYSKSSTIWGMCEGP